MNTLTADDLKILSAPFDEKTIGIKVQSFSKDKTKAMLVAYLQHTDVYTRIEQVDTGWTMKITNSLFIGDACFVRVAITIKGVTRENEGEGTDPKSATSDAIKRAAMLFGVGRYLYDADTVWVPYNEQTDRFKTFSYADYKRAARPGQSIAPMPGSPPSTSAQVKKPTPATPTKASLGKSIFDASQKLGLSEDDLASLIIDDFNKSPDQLTLSEMQTCLEKLEYSIGREGK